MFGWAIYSFHSNGQQKCHLFLSVFCSLSIRPKFFAIYLDSTSIYFPLYFIHYFIYGEGKPHYFFILYTTVAVWINWIIVIIIFIDQSAVPASCEHMLNQMTLHLDRCKELITGPPIVLVRAQTPRQSQDIFSLSFVNRFLLLLPI